MIRLSENLLSARTHSYGSIVLGLTCAIGTVPAQGTIKVDNHKVKFISNISKNIVSDRYKTNIDLLLDPSPINSDIFLENLFENLCDSQKELGTQFEEVLFENLWDLYES